MTLHTSWAVSDDLIILDKIKCYTALGTTLLWLLISDIQHIWWFDFLLILLEPEQRAIQKNTIFSVPNLTLWESSEVQWILRQESARIFMSSSTLVVFCSWVCTASSCGGGQRKEKKQKHSSLIISLQLAAYIKTWYAMICTCGSRSVLTYLTERVSQ